MRYFTLMKSPHSKNIHASYKICPISHGSLNTLLLFSKSRVLRIKQYLFIQFMHLLLYDRNLNQVIIKSYFISFHGNESNNEAFQKPHWVQFACNYLCQFSVFMHWREFQQSGHWLIIVSLQLARHERKKFQISFRKNLVNSRNNEQQPESAVIQ